MANQSADPNLLRGKLCPYVGFIDDRETALSYPAEHNCCYHAEPVCPVNLDKQREYCLSSRYNACPVYLRETIQKLPMGWSGKRLSSIHKPKPWMMLVMAVALVGLVLLLSYLFGAFEKPAIPRSTQPVVATSDFYPITSTPSEVVLPPTETITPEPTLTSIPVQLTEIVPHMLETAFGSDPQMLVHQIQQGEGFIMLAEKYGTSMEAIQAINYELPETLLYNQIIVIPLNSTDISSLPPFSAYQEQTGGVTIDELANRMNLDPFAFRLYNELPEGYIVSQGEWLLIPH